MEVTRKGLGMTAIVDESSRVLGVFTDGDLRRALDRAADLHRTRMDEVMTREPSACIPRRSRWRRCCSWRRTASPRSSSWTTMMCWSAH